jgi:hypothetical protein
VWNAVGRLIEKIPSRGVRDAHAGLSEASADVGSERASGRRACRPWKWTKVFRMKVVVMIQKGWSTRLIAGRWSKLEVHRALWMQT